MKSELETIDLLYDFIVYLNNIYNDKKGQKISLSLNSKNNFFLGFSEKKKKKKKKKKINFFIF